MLSARIILIIICLFFWEIYFAAISYPPVEVKPEEMKIVKVEEVKYYATGTASWYDYKLEGIEWSKDHNTAASRTLVRYETYTVTNLKNGKSVDVFINDFGPEEWTGREIDLSSHAFGQIADLSLGLINVKIEKLCSTK